MHLRFIQVGGAILQAAGEDLQAIAGHILQVDTTL